MESPEQAPVQGHVRNKSSITRANRPRASTKGPLDVDDDPLTSPRASTESPPVHPSPSNSAKRSTLSNNPSTHPAEFRAQDFSFLLRPEIFHPLTPLNIPSAFRNSQLQPSPTAPLEELISNGHFRAAAIAAVQELTGSGANGPIDPKDAKRIFDLLYVRLSCLTLIAATPLAAQEGKALEDLNDARKYVDENTGKHVVPWELRVLNVRLQALGFGDPRRAVMSYHDLAKEAREEIVQAGKRQDSFERGLWKARLHELGLKVAGALIDMEDFSGAAHHLRTLRDHGDGKLAMAKALLWLHIGDAAQARECAKGAVSEDDENGSLEKTILALCDMANADYTSAVDRWTELRDVVGKDDELVGANMAVCLLYLGRMPEGRQVLEGLVDSGLSSHTLLFNLSTMYELCTEKNRNMKSKLAERVAANPESTKGWEKTNADFKL